MEKQLEYIGTSILLRVLTNEQRFVANKFGDEAIEKYSIIKELQVDPRSPTQVGLNIELEEVEDDSDYI